MVPWNVYANPHEPHLYAHMSLYRYIFTYIQLLVEGSPLFEGLNQYARHEKLFMTLVKENMDELNTIGVLGGGYWYTLLQEGCGHHGCSTMYCVLSNCFNLYFH